MAKLFPWVCFLLVALNPVLSGTEKENNLLGSEQELDPVTQVLRNDGDAESRGDREKRLGFIKKIGVKAGLLDFVFGKIDSFIDAKTRAVVELDKQNIYKNEKYFGITYPPKAPQNNLKYWRPSAPSTSSTLAPVDFSVDSAVSLVIPDRLYGNSFTLVTNASRILGDVIYNTADRAQELADRINSKLKNKFFFAKKFIKFTHPVIQTSSGSSSSNHLAKRDVESSAS